MNEYKSANTSLSDSEADIVFKIKSMEGASDFPFLPLKFGLLAIHVPIACPREYIFFDMPELRVKEQE